jgi:hypothetical protein
VRIQGRFYPKRCSSPCLPIDHSKVGAKESTHPCHWLRSRPCSEVHRRTSDELGAVPREPVGTGLQGSTRLGIQIPLQLASYTDRFHRMGDARRCDLPGHRAI